MKKSIQIAYDELFPLKCTLAAKAGFRDVAVNFTPVLDKSESEWDAITEHIGTVLAENGLSCNQIHPYYYDLRISSEIREERCEFAMKQSVKAAAKLGAAWCTFHPRSAVSRGFSVKAALEDNRRDLGSYLEVAHKYGTGIAAENLPIFDGIRPVMPFYSSNPEDLCELVDGFADEKMGVCWDFGHANLMCFDMAEKIRLVGSRIKCTHVHNNMKNFDDHLPPDQGNIDWEKAMAALHEVGYTGALTLETHCQYAATPVLEAFVKYNYGCLAWLETLFQ